MQQVGGRLPCHGEAGAAESALRRLQQGRIFRERDVLPKPLLHLLAKAGDELAVARADCCVGLREVGQKPLQVREQRGERSPQRQAPARGGAAEFAQQHFRKGTQIRLPHRRAVQHDGDASLEMLRQAGPGRAQLIRDGRREGDHDAGGLGLETEGVHCAGRDQDHRGRAQHLGTRIQPRFHPPALDQQDLVEVPVAVWPNDPIVQPAAGGDGLDVDQPLVRRLQGFAV